MRYVGSACNIANRWSKHLRELRRGTHHCHHLQAAWVKYGEAVFAFQVLEVSARREHLLAIEQTFLDYYKHLGLYNSLRTAGSRLGVPHTCETKQKMVVSAKLRPPNPDARRKQADAIRGRHPSPETRQRLSAALQGHTRNTGRVQQADERARRAEALRGHVVSVEARDKISAAQRGRTRPTTQYDRFRKRVKQVDPTTSAVVAIFDGVTMAATAMGVVTSAITQALRSTTGRCGGFLWEYVDGN